MDVVLLTRQTCAFCADAKEILDRLAAEFSLSVWVIDLDSAEGQELALRGGVMFPPGIFVGGDLVCYGRPSERRIRRELERRLVTRATPDAH